MNSVFGGGVPEAGATAPVALETTEPRRKAGRPRGSLGAVLTDLSDRVTMEDFAFLRALLNGIDPTKAFEQYYEYRHFDAKGNGVVPHGLTLAAHGRQLMDAIMKGALLSGDELVHLMAERLKAHHLRRVENARREGRPLPSRSDKKARAVPSMNEWMESENVDPDFYTEVELIERYKEFLDAYRVEHEIAPSESGPDENEMRAAVEAQIQAINLLQNRLTSFPMPNHPVHTWVDRTIALQLVDQGVNTLGDLVVFISNIGRNWPRRFKGLGPVRSKRLEAWLDANQATLGNIIREGKNWEKRPPMKRRIEPLMDLSSSAGQPTRLIPVEGSAFLVPAEPGSLALREGIAPLELMLVPPHLDGATGLYRGHGVNQFGVSNDMQAVRMWLNSYLLVNKHATFDAYRREIERFYVWCLIEARIPLSSVSLGHALAYQQFLKSIPAKYITTERVTRDDLRWRPFRGQLEPKSQAYAIGVVGQFFETALKNGYLSSNAFTSIKSAALQNRDLDTSRSLNAQDLLWLKQELDEHLATSSGRTVNGFDLDGALRRRMHLIFLLGLSTGMRRTEITTGTVQGIQRAMVNGLPDDGHWMLEVVGKGKKLRTVPISEEIRQLVLAHHDDVRRMLRASGKEASERLKKFEDRPPLICALRAPVDQNIVLVNDEAMMANDNLSLGKAGLYKVIKSFIVGASKPHVRECERRLAKIDSQLKTAEARRDIPAADALQEQRKEVQRELAIWTRRSSMSTHWMRHTFAIGILRDNPNDAGLKLVQQLLGHSSIATTQIYLKVDDTQKTRAVTNHRPFG